MKFARVKNPKLKTYNEDVCIMTSGFQYVVVKVISTGRTVRMRLKNLEFHKEPTYLYKNQIGTITRRNFVAFLTGEKVPVVGSLRPRFFQYNDKVRLMISGQGYVGCIESIDIKTGFARIRVETDGSAYRVVLRRFDAIQLIAPESKPDPDFKIAPSKPVDMESIVKQVDENASSLKTSYHLTIKKNNGREDENQVFESKEKMQKFIDALVNPDIVESIFYRVAQTTFAPPVVLKRITTFKV